MNAIRSAVCFLGMLVCIELYAVVNFDLLNGDPKVPVYVQANGGEWQVLDQKHYRFPIDVPENSLLIMNLSAHEDHSAPVSLIFAPERALEIAHETGSKITRAPTFYVTAQVVSEQTTGTGVAVKHVRLAPQQPQGSTGKTKSGLSLAHNVTQEMIDMIIGIASSDDAGSKDEQPGTTVTEEVKVIPIADPSLPVKGSVEPVEAVLVDERPAAMVERVAHAQHHKEQGLQKKEEALTSGPLAYQSILLHKHTPQMIVSKLESLKKELRSRKKLWQATRDYLMTEKALEHYKGAKDQDVFKELKAHYQDLADKTSSDLKDTFNKINEFITYAHGR